MKTAELSGALLDYWVARAEGGKVKFSEDGSFAIKDGARFEPSTRWAHGGAVIERNEISVYASVDWESEQKHSLLHWVAVGEKLFRRRGYLGPTPLVAAMRAYVATEFGDEVPNEVGGI